VGLGLRLGEYEGRYGWKWNCKRKCESEPESKSKCKGGSYRGKNRWMLVGYIESNLECGRGGRI
jgi:hypothetical protein